MSRDDRQLTRTGFRSPLWEIRDPQTDKHLTLNNNRELKLRTARDWCKITPVYSGPKRERERQTDRDRETERETLSVYER